MQMLTKQDYAEIRTWVYRNARPLELSLWQYFFENGNKTDVLTALCFYQNSDGGFGHALEPDNWNPVSSPYTTLYAANTLKSIDFTDTAHPVYTGILRYLDSGAHYTDEHGWLFSIPSNNDHAHAPWWTYSPEANTCESTGLTAELAAFILRTIEPNTRLYKQAMDQAGRIIAIITTPGKLGEMSIGGFNVLLDTAEKLGLSATLGAGQARETLRQLVHDSIVRDTSSWETYCPRPSNYIKSPNSPYYADNAVIVQTELDYLIKTRPAGSVWDIQWTWFDLSEKYAGELAVSTNWWKAIMAVEKMRYLKSFDRVETSI